MHFFKWQNQSTTIQKICKTEKIHVNSVPWHKYCYCFRVIILNFLYFPCILKACITYVSSYHANVRIIYQNAFPWITSAYLGPLVSSNPFPSCFVFPRKCFKCMYEIVFLLPFDFYHFLLTSIGSWFWYLLRLPMPLFFSFPWLLKPALGTNKAEMLLWCPLKTRPTGTIPSHSSESVYFIFQWAPIVPLGRDVMS